MILFALALVLQQGNESSPPAGDTVRYWQQGVRYSVVAVLDEARLTLRGVGDMVYINHSPDTLREMYVHQYLNAFRPRSKWSEVDEREGRVRFQHLADPDYGYERFTTPPTVNGKAVRVEYPGAPDSTVARFALPAPLAPGDSVAVHFEWDARPSTVPRRQARRGRHWDFSQWYPKVAVYDRLGWQPNPLVPAGELYGEFGTYDVTVIVARDQIVAGTGVVVAGDPGWEGAKKWGTVHEQRDFYPEARGAGIPPVPDGFKAVRFYARDVHGFAWTASPDYRYEGGMYAGRVPIHVLYQPGDEAEWGNGQAVGRTATALEWLESIYGPYAYPQETNLHRVDGGGTEFPMMIMDGSASLGLILHETGHIFTFGILANNEWRSAWMDEGLTSFQTSWALRASPIDRAQSTAMAEDSRAPGYRGLAHIPQSWQLDQMQQYELVMRGIAQPIGRPAYAFKDFGVYNSMVYDRAESMYNALRDVLGDSGTAAWLRRYYGEWKLKHVDEAAIRSAAERSSGKELGWFFEQWVHRVGLIDYALTDIERSRVGDAFVTRARVVRRGDYRHPMPVGVRTSAGWTIVRADALPDEQWVEMRTTEEPSDVQLDPMRTTEDWDRTNNFGRRRVVYDSRVQRLVFDWPFLDQADRDKEIIALAPLAWYSSTGGLNLALRARGNYLGAVGQSDGGIAYAFRSPRYTGTGASVRAHTFTRVQGWTRVENPRLPWSASPVWGLGYGLAALDGIAKADVHRAWNDSPYPLAGGPRITHSLALTASFPYESKWLDFRRFTDVTTIDASGELTWRGAGSAPVSIRAMAMGGYLSGQHVDQVGGHFLRRAEIDLKKLTALTEDGETALFTRVFIAAAWDSPLQRSVGLSALDLTETFSNHLLRPKGSPFSPDDEHDIHYTALGGFALRGYSPLLRLSDAMGASANVELAHALLNVTDGGRGTPPLRLWLSAFGDVGTPMRARLGEGAAARVTPADAGVGIALRGSFFDRGVHLRAEFPIWVRQPALGVGRDPAKLQQSQFRWTFSLNDLW